MSKIWITWKRLWKVLLWWMLVQWVSGIMIGQTADMQWPWCCEWWSGRNRGGEVSLEHSIKCTEHKIKLTLILSRSDRAGSQIQSSDVGVNTPYDWHITEVLFLFFSFLSVFFLFKTRTNSKALLCVKVISSDNNQLLTRWKNWENQIKTKQQRGPKGLLNQGLRNCKVTGPRQ